MYRLIALLLSICACSEPINSPELSFAPIPELKAYTSAMVDRYSQAMGRIDISVSSEGDIPVFFQEDLESRRSDGNWGADCAQTTVHRKGGEVAGIEIKVDPTPPAHCSPIQVALLHEGGHAIAPDAPHASEGMFSVDGKGSRVDESALESLCAHTECPLFNPE